MSLRTFRTSFQFSTKDIQNWFPGHMVKGMRQLQQRLKETDCIIEVHDARIPFSGRNEHFRDSLLLRPHILMLNKVDLIDGKSARTVKATLEEQGYKHVMFTNCKNGRDSSLRKLIPTIVEMMETAPRFHRDSVDEYNLMVIGVPNVGKSSLINHLRQRNLKKRGKATAVAPHAGVTRSVLERIRVCDTPKMYVFDSPGILAPAINDIDVGMKLAVCATMQDHLVGEDIIADYLLYWLNKHGKFRYVKQYGLQEATDNIMDLLYHIAKQKQLFQKVKSPEGRMIVKPNFQEAANVVLRHFRSGTLGKIMLDQDQLMKSEQDDLNQFVKS